LFLALLLLGGSITAAQAQSGAPAKDGDPLLQALQSEMSRSVTRLRLDDFEAPYFISYRLTDVRSTNYRASYGALTNSGGDRYRALAVDVRVGDYVDDNTSDDDGFYFDPRDSDSYTYSRRYAPIDNDTAALRQELWLLTDFRYKTALESFIGERGRRVQKVDKPDRPDDFSAAAKVDRLDPIDTLTIDKKRWENIVRVISARFKSQPLIHASDVDFMATAQIRYLLTSEGTRLRTNLHNYSLAISVETRADDGMPISLETVWKSHEASGMPDSSAIAFAADSLAQLLLQLREAPIMEPYTGPAIIRRGASGVFFHEALGHRLEGHRTRRESEGHTFKHKMNQRIIPDFLDVYDDPTQKTAAGTELYGNYEYDDEGVAARRTPLVEKGILTGFLMCRTPIKDIKTSNGHGRGDMWNEPVSRMGSLFVTTNSPVTYDALRVRLLEECKSEGKEYGLVFEDIAAGETNTSSYGVQTLRVRPRVVKKVYVADGREELVRGVELIGTPLAVLESIQAAGDDPGVFNGVCGAESGWVPVSAIAPSVLVGEIEVQRMDRNLKRGPILPPPLHDPGT
jgi:predicted Zn-dependent protease